MHIPDIQADPEYTWSGPQKFGEYRAMLGVPLMREGTPIGVLAMTRNKPRPFTPAQIELMSTFADQAVIAIETLRLFNEVRERTAEIERTRKVMQTAFDNMDDGVALLDKDMRLQFMSQERIKSRQLAAGAGAARRAGPRHHAVPGAARRLRAGRRAKRTSSARSKPAIARMTTPGGTRYVRREDGRHIEFSFKPISDGGILAVFRDITELQQREEALAAAKEDVERTRELMQTVLDNMGDGVTLWDKDFRWKFSNRMHIQRQAYPPELLRAGADRLRHDPLPGAARRIRPADGDAIEQKVQEIAAIIRDPSGGRYERRTMSGRYVEFTYSPLADGSVLGVYRDITELKDREQALAAAKEDVERTRAVMQTVLDNMNDGVTAARQGLPHHVRQRPVPATCCSCRPRSREPGHSCRGHHPLPGQARRLRSRWTIAERVVRERRAMMLTPGGIRYDRKTVSGRHIEFNYKPLADGGLLGVHRDITELKEREEALALARGGDAVGARQHERRRHAVRPRLPLQVHQSAR